MENQNDNQTFFEIHRILEALAKHSDEKLIQSILQEAFEK